MKSVFLAIAVVLSVGQLAQALDREMRYEERREVRREVRREIRREEHRPPPVWRGHPGYHRGWDGRRYEVRPGWFFATWALRRPFIFVPVIYPGYYQCTAFNNQGVSFSAIGPDRHQAAYGAVMQCEASPWGRFGCFIPPGYCQLR